MIKKPRPKHSMKLEDGDEIRLEKIELSSTHKTVQLIHNKSVPFKTWFYKGKRFKKKFKKSREVFEEKQ